MGLFSIAYILFGIAPWIALTILTVFAQRRLRKLEEDRSILQTPAPSLAIIVPARNEEGGIVDCVARLQQQNYPGASIVVVNDRSTDSTGRLLDEMRARSTGSSLKIIHLTELPEGWLGKNHALYLGTRDLDVDWLMFVDSDVTLDPQAVRRIVACCVERGYDAMSLMPALDARSTLERTLLPLLAVCWSVMFRINLTNDDNRPHHAFANGQLFLIRRSWYEKVGGHEGVKNQIVEDVMLMRALKRAGARCRLLFGQSLAQCRMHTNLTQMFDGWARIFAGSSQRRVTPILGTLLFLMLQPILLAGAIALLISSDQINQLFWAILVGFHVAIILSFGAGCYRGARQRMANILLLPLAWPLLLAIIANAIRVCFTGRVDWRGNAVKVNG